MKAKTISTNALYLIAVTLLLFSNFGCAAFFDAAIDAGISPPRLEVDDNGDLTKGTNSEFYSRQIAGVSAGIGYNAFNDNNTTSLCAGAEYLYRISEDNYDGASYLGASATYHYESADEFKFNSVRLAPKFTYFDRLTKNGEVDVTYGIKAHYEFGSVENFGNKDDLTGYGVEAIIGANFNVNKNFSLGFEVPFASWSERTLKFDGGEIKQDNSWVGLNKDNMVMAYGRFRF